MRRALYRLGWVALAGTVAPPAAAQILPRPPVSPPTIYETSGRYRIAISGFACAKETVDNNKDGAKDEVYAAASFVLFDRRDGRLISTPNVVRTVEYGDRGGRIGNRIQAGTASRSGGIWGGNNGDYVPNGLDPRATVGPQPLSEKLPLLVFEGGLSNGVEALLLAPSLWEWDSDPKGFNTYANNWKTAGVGSLINSPAVQNQFGMTGLTPIVAPANTTMAEVANFFGGPVSGFLANLTYLMTTAVDRPIGLNVYQSVGNYQDRLLVITREKLESLAVGSGVTVAIPLAEPFNNQLNGLYTVYVRVERTQ